MREKKQGSCITNEANVVTSGLKRCVKLVFWVVIALDITTIEKWVVTIRVRVKVSNRENGKGNWGKA